MQSIWAALRYYWIISISIGKWAKPDLSDLENDLSNNSINSISWQLTNIIPKKLYIYKIENSYDTVFEKISKKSKIPKFEPFLTFQTLKNAKIEKKLTNRFWENGLQVKNVPNLTFPTFIIDLSDD